MGYVIAILFFLGALVGLITDSFGQALAFGIMSIIFFAGALSGKVKWDE